MNIKQIIKMCYAMIRDYEGMGRKRKEIDEDVINLLMYMYNTTEIDLEEVNGLMKEYLESGSLDFPKAMEQARRRNY